MFSKGGVHEKSLVTLKTHRFRSFCHYFSKIGPVKSRFVKNIIFLVSLSFVSSFCLSYFSHFVTIFMTICVL